MSGYAAFGITPHRKAKYHRTRWEGKPPAPVNVLVLGYVEDDNGRTFVTLDEDGRCLIVDIENVTLEVPELEPQVAY